MRQVYYDPFGMRLAGQQAGIRDEAFLQDQTRQARASDYNFNVLQPLQLHDMQRNSNFADYADPYLRRGLGYQEDATKGGLYDAEYGRRGRLALATGDQNPIRQLDMERYPAEKTVPGHVQALPPHPLVQAYDDWTGLMQQYGLNDPTSMDAEILRNSVEQSRGLPEGALLDTDSLRAAIAMPAQFETTPQVQYRMNPYTGQMEAIPNNPTGYYDLAAQPMAYQNALLGVQRGNMENRGDYNDIFRQQTENSAAKGGAGLPPYHGMTGE